MALHCGLDRYDVPWWDGAAVFMFSPPRVEGCVGAYVEALFGGWGFRERVRDVRAVEKEVLRCRYRVEDAGARVVGAVGVCVIEDPDLSAPGRPITGAPRFLTTVKFFHRICPDKIHLVLCKMDHSFPNE